MILWRRTCIGLLVHVSLNPMVNIHVGCYDSRVETVRLLQFNCDSFQGSIGVLPSGFKSLVGAILDYSYDLSHHVKLY